MTLPRRDKYRLYGAGRTEKSSGWSISTVLAILFIVSLVSPLMSWIGRGLLLSWVVFALWLLAVSFRQRLFLHRLLKTAAKRQVELFMLGAWLLVVFSNAILGRGYSGVMHLMIMVTLAMTVFMEIVYTEERDESRKVIVTAVIVFLGLEALRSLPTLWSEPLLPRLIMAAGAGSSLYQRAVLSSVGEYGLYTACAIALPVMLATALDMKGLRRTFMLFLSVIIATAIVLASFLGATLLMVIGFLLLGTLVVTNGREKMRSIFFFLIVGVIGVALWYVVLADTAAGEMVASKLVRQSEGVLELGLLEGDQTNRAELWEISVNTFLQNPIVGIGPSTGTENPYMGYRVGGHSSWLDIAAEYGAIGLVFYVGFLFAAIKRAVVFRKMDRSRLVGVARVISCVLFFVGGSYNPVVFTIQVNALFFFLALSGAKAISPVNSRKRSRLFRRYAHGMPTHD